MTLAVYFIDAFTDKPFGGNPAAVILLEHWLDDALMQAMASEHNLSETAFVVHDAQTDRYQIRWFSPLQEITFCGHATLASSYVLFNILPKQNSSASKPPKELIFDAHAVGDIKVTRTEEGRMQMRFPNRLPMLAEYVPVEISDGLSIEPETVYQNAQAYVCVYTDAESVVNVQADAQILASLAPYDVCVTAALDTDNTDGDEPPYDFVCRYFWPASGGIEDPVTGSMYAGLAPLWAEQLDKTSLIGYQASSRGGVVYCELDNGHNQVIVAGHAVHYMTGHIQLSSLTNVA